MKPQWSNEQLSETIIAVVVRALRIDPARATMDAKIIDDVGAESLDVLDIRFSLEQELGAKIDQTEMMRRLGDGLSAADIRKKFTIGWLVQDVSQHL